MHFRPAPMDSILEFGEVAYIGEKLLATLLTAGMAAGLAGWPAHEHKTLKPVMSHL